MKVTSYSDSLLNSIKEWRQSSKKKGALPKGYIEENIHIYLDKKIEYEAFHNMLERGIFDSNKSSKILDVGSGIGKFISVCNEKRFYCIGLEPSQGTCELAKKILKEEGSSRTDIVCGRGEELPFFDETFDVITSITVLEHVKDIRKTISESLRVLKKHGVFYLVVPNFLSFWEGHYAVFFIPYFLSIKSIFKLYVKLRGRNAERADSINFNINPIYINNILKNEEISKVDDVSLKRFYEKYNDPDSIVNPKISTLLKMLRRLRLVKLLGISIIRLMGLLKIYTPIVLIVHK